MAKRKGYLIFTTHDGDEVDATFIEDKELFDQLYACKTNDDAYDLWRQSLDAPGNKYYEKENQWATQTRCNTKWPFNDVEILGTYYLLVY